MNPAVVALILANIIWGAAPPLFKLALTNIPPFTLGFVRFAIASVILFPAAIVRWKKMSFQDFLATCLTSFFTIFLMISLGFIGLQEGESIDAALIYSSGPVFLFLGAIFFLREKPDSRVFKGMIVALIGAILITLSPALLGGGENVGTGIFSNILFIGSTISMVVGTIVSKRTLERVDPYQFTAITFFFSTILFGLFAVPEMATFSFSDLNSAGWIGIVYGSIFSSVAAYALYYYGTSKIDAQEIGVFTYVDPVVAVLVAVPLLNEIFSLWHLVGILLIAAGIFYAEGRIHWYPIRRALRKLR